MRAANAGDDGNDKFFDAAKLRALKTKRAEIMRDMEQEAEMEGGPIADKYGDMLNKLDKAIAMLQGSEEKEYTLREGFYGPGGVESITNALGYSDPYEFFEDNPGAVDALLDWAEMVPEFNEMLQDADLLQERYANHPVMVQLRTKNAKSKKDDKEDDKKDVKEDYDLGHEDNEPHMLKADLYRIGKYAMELYQMVDRFEEGSEEVDFPHWWQAKVIKAKDMLVSAKHYLDFEVKEPQIDAMVDVAQEEDVIDEAAGKFVVRPCSNPGTPFAVWQTSKDGENDKRIEGFKTKEDAQKFADEKNSLNEGTWSVGTSKEIKNVMGLLDVAMDIKDPQELIDHLNMHDKSMYNIVGDDLFHDDIDGAKSEAAEGNMDRAQNRLSDAYSRAAFFQERQMDRESARPYKTDIFEEEEVNTRHIEDNEYMAAKIQKAMNDLDKSSEDYESKLYRLQQARKANNKGDFKMAMKIMKPFLAEGKVCESCGKMHEGSCSSSIAEKLAEKLKSN
jgi:hypothetical protein